MPNTDASRPLLSRGQKWTLVVSCLGVALVIGSMAALYTSLADIAADTGASQSQLTWIVDGYTLAVACLVLPAGAVGDRYGRRAVLLGGLVVFSAASAVPLVVQDPAWLIGARALAGVGAAFVMPSTLSIMTAEFPAHQRPRAVAIWAGVAGSGAILGIFCSGLLLQLWSWQSIFVGLTAAGVVLLIAALTVSESLEYAHPDMDYVGSLTVAVAIGLIVIALTEAPHRGWTDPLVLVLFAGGAVAAAIFAVVELRRAHPLLDLRLFADRGFGSGTLSITLQFLVLFGVFYVLIQYLQLIVGYEPFRSALALAPVIVPIVGISLLAPWLAERLGLRVLIVPGMLAIAAGIFLASRLEIDSSYTSFLWALLIMGTGLGLSMAPATAAIVAATPVEKQGVAAAVNDAAREVGAAVGIAIAGSVLAAGYTNRITPALSSLPGPAREPFSDSLAAALQAADQSGPAREQLATIAKSAFMHGYEHAGVVLSGITVASALILAIWAPGRRDATGSNAESRCDDQGPGTTASPHTHIHTDDDSVSMPDTHDASKASYQQGERFDDST